MITNLKGIYGSYWRRNRVKSVVMAVLLTAGVASAGWNEYPGRPTQNNLYAVDMLSEGEGWAVGYWGIILKCQGNVWAVDRNWPNATYLYDVDFKSSEFGMAVGSGGKAIKYQNGLWSEAAGLPTAGTFYGVSLPPGTENVAWAVGNGGRLYKYANNEWTQVSLGTTVSLNDVHFRSANYGWVCGANGNTWRYDGSTWTNFKASTTNLYCIFAVQLGNVWAGGDNGKIYHFEGVNWSVVATPTTARVRSLYFLSLIHI